MLETRNVVERARALLGTHVIVRAGADGRMPAGALEAAVDAAFARIADVHRAMSFHEPDSELSRLHREAARACVPVGPDLQRVLRAALALARASDGLFDPTVAARLVESGHLPRPAGPSPDPDADWRDIAFHSGRGVRFRKPLWLDLGGIAKGYAVDAAVRALQRAGMQRGIVNAGSDLRVFGDLVEVVHIRDPVVPVRNLPLVELRDGAIATSSGCFSQRNGRSALVHPRSDVRLGDGVSASVSAPRAIWADALTKLVLAEPEAALPLLRRLHAQAVTVDAQRRVRMH